jgi:hypothetical protein
MAENVTIMIVFFLLVGLGLMFYSKISRQNALSEIEKKDTLDALSVSQLVLNMPELGCSNDNVIVEGCIDKFKLMSVGSIFTLNELFYFDIFQFSTVSVNVLYPEAEEFVIYSRESEDLTETTLVQFPISVYDSASDLYSFGVLKVEVHS